MKNKTAPNVQQQRATFVQEVAEVDPEHLVFVDESGANTARARTYGRALAGERVPGTVPGHWESVTMLSGMRQVLRQHDSGPGPEGGQPSTGSSPDRLPNEDPAFHLSWNGYFSVMIVSAFT